MDVCCVLLGRGLCDELITRPEESYRVWCVVVIEKPHEWGGPGPRWAAVPQRERERERERETFCSTVYDTFCYEVKRADGLESMNLVLPTVTSTGSWYCPVIYSRYDTTECASALNIQRLNSAHALCVSCNARSSGWLPKRHLLAGRLGSHGDGAELLHLLTNTYAPHYAY